MTNTQEIIMKGDQPLDFSANWIQVAADDTNGVAAIEKKYGLDFKKAGNKVWETDKFLYLPFSVERRDGDTVSRENLVFALSDDILITLQPNTPFDLFDRALSRMRRMPSLGNGPHAIACSLIWALKESCEQVIAFMSDVLDNMAEEIQEATVGDKKTGVALTDAEMKKVVLELHECEKVLSRANDAELTLSRIARHLQGEVVGKEISTQVSQLLSDLRIALERAGYEEKKIRFLQELILTTLSQKQSGIIKVFTIITAVFLPPTLMSTFYGMNFTHMPELMTQHGFLICVIMTALVSLLPIVYIQRAGWLR